MLGKTGLSLHNNTVLEPYDQLIEYQGPIRHRLRPFFDDPFAGQIQQLSDRLWGWKGTLGLGHFAQLTMIALDGIGGIDQPSDLVWVVEKGR